MSYYAAVLGAESFALHASWLPDGRLLGNLKSAGASLWALEGCVQVGSVREGKPILTYPCPMEKMRDVSVALGHRIGLLSRKVGMCSRIAAEIFTSTSTNWANITGTGPPQASSVNLAVKGIPEKDGSQGPPYKTVRLSAGRWIRKLSWSMTCYGRIGRRMIYR
ncbi:hypothetical protein EMCG_06573 [[Emmonsia] crescens]|uniref:Uncharacterized protein n=1 Tax=[Emmonsia] crescens TaxID=73230 RepID=A0A0G2IAU6_9EURO|nr:hypothetical protein EMCG_06573 [Emmonsia crescens UAMH 3008]